MKNLEVGPPANHELLVRRRSGGEPTALERDSMDVDVGQPDLTFDDAGVTARHGRVLLHPRSDDRPL
jgi:hypothetical protein